MIEFSAAMGLIILDVNVRSLLNVPNLTREQVRGLFMNLTSTARTYNVILSRFEVEEVLRLVLTRNLIFPKYTLESVAERLKRAVESNGGNTYDELLNNKKAMACFGLMAFDETLYTGAYNQNAFENADDLRIFLSQFGFEFDALDTSNDYLALDRLSNFFDATRGTPNQEKIAHCLNDFHELGWIRPDLIIDIKGGCASSLTKRPSYKQKVTFL